MAELRKSWVNTSPANWAGGAMGVFITADPMIDRRVSPEDGAEGPTRPRRRTKSFPASNAGGQAAGRRQPPQRGGRV